MFHQLLSEFCVRIRTVSLAVWLLVIKTRGKLYTSKERRGEGKEADGREEKFEEEREGKERKRGHHMVQPTQHADVGGGGGAPNLTQVTPI